MVSEDELSIIYTQEAFMGKFGIYGVFLTYLKGKLMFYFQHKKFGKNLRDKIIYNKLMYFPMM